MISEVQDHFCFVVICMFSFACLFISFSYFPFFLFFASLFINFGHFLSISLLLADAIFDLEECFIVSELLRFWVIFKDLIVVTKWWYIFA